MANDEEKDTAIAGYEMAGKRVDASTRRLACHSSVSNHLVRLEDADEAAKFLSHLPGSVSVTEEQSKKMRRKLDHHVLPFLMIVYFIQFVDKTTLGSSSILGIIQDNHLSQEQYNWLVTIFYLSYLCFEWPQNLGLQRFPAAKWLAINIVIWGIALCAHAACHSFAGLFVCRLVLGACEGAITAGFLVLTSMFYTHSEATRRIGYWNLMNGTAQIFSGLVSFGVYHTSAWRPWKTFVLINGGLTLIIGVCFWFFVPDNPMSAGFLTKEEKMIAVQRLRHQSTGIENKTWKREQFWEAITDWKSLMFAAYAAVSNVSNSSFNMMSLIIESFGFTTGQTTLLGCVNGAMEILAIYSAVLIARQFPNSRSYIAAAYAIPNIISGILLVALPWSAKGALLFSVYLSFWGGPDFVLVLAWTAATTTGHTKKTTTNAMLLIGYCLGNLLSPHMWQSKYAPRYYLPWGIILGTYVMRPLVLLVMRYYLDQENKRRDTQPDDLGKYMDEHGREVDPTWSDITDRKNKAFRYPL